jgi:F-type H+-transporting ATPase subunit c
MNGEIIASLTQNLATATPEVLNATTEIVKATTTSTPYILYAVAACMTIGASICAITQGRVIEKVAESIARQPESASDLRGSMIIGLAMVESMAIYCLLIAILLLLKA